MTGQELFEKAQQNFESNPDMAVKYLREAAKADPGHPIALEMVAIIHETGDFFGNELPFKANPYEAVSCYEKLASAPNNSAKAMLKLGMIYCSGKCGRGSIDVDAQKFKKGRDYIRDGCDKFIPDNPFDQQFCIEVGLFVGQGESNEDGRSDITAIKQSIVLLNKGLADRDSLKQFYDERNLQEIEKYLENRKGLLKSEEDLGELKEKLKDLTGV